MKRNIIILLIAVIAGCVGAYAQQPDKSKWVSQLREYKHEYLAKELQLTREQKDRFFAIYDKMDDEIMKLNGDTRALERKINDSEGEEVSDLEYDMATQAMLDLKCKECEIERNYYEQLADVLSKKQLFQLKKAEREFSMQMMKQHHKIKNKRSQERTQE